MKRLDAAIIAGALLAAAALWFFSRGGESAVPAYAEIYVGGELREKAELTDTPAVRRVTAYGGYNEILIGTGGVAVTGADCPGRDCVRAGRITRPGEILACLPHRLVIKLTGGAGGSEVDAVAG